MTIMDKRIEQIFQLAAIAVLVIGCLMVLRPFLAAILSAAILCFSTWPIYEWLERKLNGRSWLAALAMTLLLVLLLVLPLVAIALVYADEIPHLFEPFWQAGDSARLGTGLGLSIARGIVEAHGGTISVRSVPGEGTTFDFDLPPAPA